MNSVHGRYRHQRGVTLIVALVLLMALALLAVWSYNSSTTNLRVVGNTQARQEALAAAQTALDQTVSSALFSQSPDIVAATPIPVDIDGDGVLDYTANVSPAPSCYRVKVVKQSDLDPDSSADPPIAQLPSRRPIPFLENDAKSNLPFNFWVFAGK